MTQQDYRYISRAGTLDPTPEGTVGNGINWTADRGVLDTRVGWAYEVEDLNEVGTGVYGVHIMALGRGGNFTENRNIEGLTYAEAEEAAVNYAATGEVYVG